MKRRILVTAVISILILCVPVIANAYKGHGKYGEYLYYEMHLPSYISITDCVEIASDITIPSEISYDGKKIPVTTIGNEAFAECRNLTNIVIPNSVKSIGTEAFAECRNLTNIVIPNSVKSIYGKAFYNCTGLTNITIPESVSFIGNASFENCSGLKNVYYGGTKQQWEKALSNGWYSDIELENAIIHYGKITTLPATTAEIVRTDTDSDTAYVFEVDAAEKYADCFVYAAVYGENGVLLEINRVPLETAEKTSISADKSANDVFAKIFIWSDANQPIIKAKEFAITNGSFDNK